MIDDSFTFSFEAISFFSSFFLSMDEQKKSFICNWTYLFYRRLVMTVQKQFKSCKMFCRPSVTFYQASVVSKGFLPLLFNHFIVANRLTFQYSKKLCYCAAFLYNSELAFFFIPFEKLHIVYNINNSIHCLLGLITCAQS